ncbi:UvrD-helicase domain-containing protein [Bifidobacterium aquikefiri]|uniref:UvrD-helicase domain-containing protein n=1 Tax=Bifidobacterium aquikefiri TaxID=1653207 RepID=UPI0039EA1A5B
MYASSSDIINVASSDIVPNINDDDVNACIDALDLDGVDQNRRDYLKSTSSCDVSACPGSGKTTLVIAKLLILTRKWSSRTRGICVLSHTNVAKDEIRKRFGTLDNRLNFDERPHFVGTIHSFIIKYLATPYLLSIGYKPKVIDESIATIMRKKYMGIRNLRLAEYFLESKHRTFDQIRLESTDRDEPFGTKLLGIAGNDTKTYINIRRAFRKSLDEGYFTPDDMLLFGSKYIELHPEVASLIRDRFPFIIIDEMQDTDEQQNEILSLLFPQNDKSICLQRLGDSNQALFATGKMVRLASHSISLSNSFRFDESIANLANRFAVSPVLPNGLVGRRKVPEQLLTIHNEFIVFDGKNISQVLPEFAKLVSRGFDQNEIEKYPVAAVGARRYGDDLGKEHDKPKYISDYLPDNLQLENDKIDMNDDFDSSIIRARLKIAENADFSVGLNQIASDFMRIIANDLSPELRTTPHMSKFRQFIHLFNSPENDDAAKVRELLFALLNPRKSLSASKTKTLCDDIQNMIVSKLQILGVSTHPYVDNFFQKLPETFSMIDFSTPLPNLRNKDCFIFDDIQIQLGTIHSVKGETHLATLLLDTFDHTSFVKSLLPWFVGDICNATGRQSDKQIARMKQCYVAMTRPTHLLAVAAPYSSLGKTVQETRQSIDKLHAIGWQILTIGSDLRS